MKKQKTLGQALAIALFGLFCQQSDGGALDSCHRFFSDVELHKRVDRLENPSPGTSIESILADLTWLAHEYERGDSKKGVRKFTSAAVREVRQWVNHPSYRIIVPGHPFNGYGINGKIVEIVGEIARIHPEHAESLARLATETPYTRLTDIEELTKRFEWLSETEPNRANKKKLTNAIAFLRTHDGNITNKTRELGFFRHLHPLYLDIPKMRRGLMGYYFALRNEHGDLTRRRKLGYVGFSTLAGLVGYTTLCFLTPASLDSELQQLICPKSRSSAVKPTAAP